MYMPSVNTGLGSFTDILSLIFCINCGECRLILNFEESALFSLLSCLGILPCSPFHCHCLCRLYKLTDVELFAWNSSLISGQVQQRITLMKDHLSGICCLISSCREFLSLPIWNFSILPFMLHWLISVVKVFLQKTNFLRTHHWILSRQLTSSCHQSGFSRPTSSIPHWHVYVVSNTFDFGIC